ncbi:hypothetical protein LEN26_002274 [Aphanomyces euteiches]|nr:hypothetical protein AeMF1_013089 [Aphanomyces euteiches]KAH9151170.1 hypothetical protein LEN26_003920 [Aphanomyces euteiches]KAH9151203.1 hypothetical protein LEN26_003911 [Aphanomyces euteiches]KAH9159576.1 hypothetical protein LEN26_002274 [Aphanomyces euteiches]KAH9186028.1 hypothetical protein AeNC1_011993 [Aphanomyces euteiches]
MNPTPEPVGLRDLTTKCINRSYDSIYNLATTLPNTPLEERRPAALTQLHDTHSIFKKLLVLTRWSVQSPVAEKCAELLQEAKLFHDQTNETNDRLFFLHADLNRAKERSYDLSTAIDVLFGGSYTRLPRLIHYAGFPRELPPVDEEARIVEINDLLRFRLIEETIPSTFSHIQVDEGFVTAQSEGEFEIVFTVDSTKPDAKWLVVSLHTVLTDTAALAKYKHLASTSALRIIQSSAPTYTHAMQLKILIQKLLNTSSTPLADAANVMRDFCCSLALRILCAQGILLTETRWTRQVEFVPHEDALDIIYWTNWTTPYVPPTNGVSVEEMRQRLHRKARAYPQAGLCLRLYADTSQTTLFSTQLFPAPPPALLAKCPDLMDGLKVPANMYGLSADHFLLGALQVHAACAIHCLAEHLVQGADKLFTGEAVMVTQSPNSLRIARLDCSSAPPIEISMDLRLGRFAVFCLASAQSSAVDSAVKQLELVLQTQCKVSLPGVTVVGTFELKFDDVQVVHQALARALREIAAFDLMCFVSSCHHLEVHRYVYGPVAASLGLSSSALFFQVVRAKEPVYLVVEMDVDAEIKGEAIGGSNRGAISNSSNLATASSTGTFGSSSSRDHDDWIRSPALSMLHISSTTKGVKSFERFPAVHKSHLSLTGKKRKRDALPIVSALVLHAVGLCHERLQWHGIEAFGRKYNVTVATVTPTLATCGFPERVNIAPLNAQAIHARMRRHGGMDLSLQLVSPPFEYIAPSKSNDSGGGSNGKSNTIVSHSVLPNGHLFFRYPEHDNPIEAMLGNLVMHVRPMVSFGIKLQKSLSAVGRYTSVAPTESSRLVFIERADPFGFVLAFRHGVDEIGRDRTLRVLVEHKAMHQHPRGAFALTSLDGFDHVLLPFIQEALNGHLESSRLIEALERTTVPLAMLSDTVCSMLAGRSTNQKDEFNVEVPYPDKTFVPSNLVLVPRSQTHVRLTYADRCAVDIVFLEDGQINIKNAPCLVRVPTYAVESGVTVPWTEFGQTLRQVLFPEMASL